MDQPVAQYLLCRHSAGTNTYLLLCCIVLLPLQLAAAQEKAAQVTENIHVPPAEIPTNTEDLLRQRQAQLQQ